MIDMTITSNDKSCNHNRVEILPIIYHVMADTYVRLAQWQQTPPYENFLLGPGLNMRTNQEWGSKILIEQVVNSSVVHLRN